MTEVIIDKRNDTVTIEGPLTSSLYTFKHLKEDNDDIVPTYILFVSDDNNFNIKITLPKCNTIITKIFKNKDCISKYI